MVGLALAQQTDLPEMTVESADTQWPAKVVLAADALDIEVDFIGRAWQGTEHIYGREYKKGQDIWFELHQDYPGRAVQHIGSVLVYQSRMMENWDFVGEDQYRYHSREATRQLEEAIEEPGNEGWEHFAMAGMLGDSVRATYAKVPILGDIPVLGAPFPPSQVSALPASERFPSTRS